ncbi:MAG: acetylxylan esterase [Sphingomonadales bacterium]|nr:acetylxylan esterase [Sphingomonadales bacterium]MDE2168503.1 acetylxylan esterase [Sphingomonadales bacterium]
MTRKHAILSRVIPVLAALALGGTATVPAAAADKAQAGKIEAGKIEAGPAKLAPYFTVATGAAKAADADGFLQRWLLLEPIDKPNRTNTVFTGTYVRQAFANPPFSGSFTTMPRDGQKVTVAGKPLVWHALDASPFDVKLFNFAQAYGKQTYGVIFWAVTVVNSPREIHDVRVAVGSNSASMWWLNGQEAASLFGDRRMVMDDVVSEPMTLHKGRNILRGAVINGPGLSDFCVRFIDEKGHPITDLTTSTR